MKRNPDGPTPAVPEGWIAMKTLARATGATRATVAHYLSLGILPQPVRTSRNMAYYDPVCVELINVVRQLRERRHLPLAVIAEMVKKQGYAEIAGFVEATSATQRDIVEVLRGDEPAARAELLAIEGISDAVLDDLETIGLVARVGPATFDPLSRQIAIVVAVMRRAGLDERTGFQVRDLAAYRDALAALVEKEMELFNRHLLGRVPPREADRLIRESLAAAEALVLAIRRRLLIGLIDSETS